MKITKFTIKGLHDFFDYKVKLNEDITFLYGENGSGKTTVLSMLDHVVSGEIYKLFNYKFKEIGVFFKENDGVDLESYNEHSVKIRLINGAGKRPTQLNVNFKEENTRIPYDKDYTNELDLFEDPDEINRIFFDSYKIAGEIKGCFNYLFLPLNRLNYQKKSLDNRDLISIRHKLIHNSISFLNNYESMRSVEQMVSRAVSQINSKINKLNEKMRQDILKSALEMSKGEVDSNEFYKYFARNDFKSELEETKQRYIKLLEDLKTITTTNQKNEYNQYFDKLITKVLNSENQGKKHENINLPNNLNGTYGELLRIKKLIKIYEDIEERILELETPIKDFLKYTNRFLKDGKDEKEIKVDSVGRLVFETNYTEEPVKLKYLSSGEKQIVTLISNLIFKVDKSKFTIFIVDEPELSLHLSWQKQLVAIVHEINRNMQLVFATHSPEIIGKYNSRAIELEKIYEPVKKNKENMDEEFEDPADYDDPIFGTYINL